MRNLSSTVNVSHGFTLTELIVTLGVIGILLAISFPAAQAIRQMARQTHCISNIRQLGIAALAYESKGTGLPAAQDRKGMSFVVSLLSTLDEQRYADQAKLHLATGETLQDRLRSLSQQRLDLLLCPASTVTELNATIPGQGAFTNHYLGIMGPVGNARNVEGTQTHYYHEYAPRPSNGPIGLDGVFSPTKNGRFVSRYLKDIKDGTSNTFMFGENSQQYNPDALGNELRGGWAFASKSNSAGLTQVYSAKSVSRGINHPFTTLNDLPFGSNHPGGTHFAFVDGSVHFIVEQVSASVLKTFSSINQNEEVEKLDEY